MLKEAQKTKPSRLLEFLTIYLTEARRKPAGWNSVIRYCNMPKLDKTPMVYGGQTFAVGDFSFSGINLQGNSAMLEPQLNIRLPRQAQGNFLDFLAQGGDARQARVVRQLVWETNADHGAEPNLSVKKEQTFYIIQIEDWQDFDINLKLSPALGLDTLDAPTTRSLGTSCGLKYRVWDPSTGSFKYTPTAEGGCPWGQTGENSNYGYCPSWGTPYFNAGDEATGNAAQDRCSLSLSGCLKRFPTNGVDQPIPFFGNLRSGK